MLAALFTPVLLFPIAAVALPATVHAASASWSVSPST
jgi:hypothetical protein